MSIIRAWVTEARLRTLPLAAASIVLGGALAFRHGVFSTPVFVLAFLTALLLQILSNFANDYGDAEKGLDDETRLGPMRAMTSGEITPAGMRKALAITACLTFLTGAALVFTAFPGTGSGSRHSAPWASRRCSQRSGTPWGSTPTATQD